MKLTLLVMTPGKQQGKALEIKTPQFLIGRDPQCQLRPSSPLISKRHCAILQRDGKVFLRDFDSTNGSFVNNEPIKGERELHHDDQLKIGPIELVVRLETATQPGAGRPTPAPATKPAGALSPAPATRPADSTPAPAIKGGGDDDIAALLLLEGGEISSSGESAGEDAVPGGSTVMELQVPPEVMAAADQAAKDKDAKAAASKKSNNDTRSAAASILEKMMRRPRT